VILRSYSYISLREKKRGKEKRKRGVEKNIPTSIKAQKLKKRGYRTSNTL